MTLRLIKRAAHFTLYIGGGIHLSRFIYSQGARVLMYHRFSAELASNAREQMAHLGRYYRVLSLSNFGRLLHDRATLPPTTVVVTVDDGYRDFYQTAYPIFRAFGIPAILFLTTGFIDRKCWMWGDRVLYCFRNTRRQSLEIAVDSQPPLRLHAGSAADASATTLKNILKRVDSAVRERVVQHLEEVADVRVPENMPPEFEPCTWDQIREMTRHGIEFGAHTVTHPILSTLGDRKRLEFELLESKGRIEEELQMPVRHFAYPNGEWRDFNLDAVEIARRNFDTSVSAVAGWNYADTDPYQLFRTSAAPECAFDVFQRRLAGVGVGIRNGQPRPHPSDAANLTHC